MSLAGPGPLGHGRLRALGWRARHAAPTGKPHPPKGAGPRRFVPQLLATVALPVEPLEETATPGSGLPSEPSTTPGSGQPPKSV